MRYKIGYQSFPIRSEIEMRLTRLLRMMDEELTVDLEDYLTGYLYSSLQGYEYDEV